MTALLAHHIVLMGFEFLCGSAGALASAGTRLRKRRGWRAIGLAGGFGGMAAAWLVNLLPGLGDHVRRMDAIGAGMLRLTGTPEFFIVVEVGIAGLVGGLLLIIVVRAFV
jgi:hypothetical protein